MTIERIEIRPGYSISRILKGGWHLAAGHNAGVDREKAIDDMAAFVEAGITSFDCADHYTGVEELIGDFRRAYPELAAKIQIHTKYVPDWDALPELKRADTVKIIDRSLKRLGVETLDAVQFFWWNARVPGAVETALVLADLRREGKIRHIGTTNFSTAQMDALLAAGVPIALNQLQYSLVDNRPERLQLDLCRRHGISVVTYGHLLGGFISSDWIGKPEPFDDFANRSLRKYKLIIEDFGGWQMFQRLLSTLERIAVKHRCDIATVASRAMLDRDQVAAVIVGATNASHLGAHRKIEMLRLDALDREAIQAILRERRGPEGDVFALERDRSGRHGRIMKYDLNQHEG